MPYPLSLQAYCLPEFYAVAPESWERRLREISPKSNNGSFLGFRKFEPLAEHDPRIPAWAADPRGDWTFADRPIWAIYRHTPKHLVTKDVAADFERHWSEIPLYPESDYPESAQVAHRRYVTDYQHFMWHSAGVRVTPFLLLHGPGGGLPMKYTAREKAILRGVGAPDEPLSIGLLPACPFDERVVQHILKRDRLIQAGNRFDELEKQNRPEWKKAEDDAAELLYRETVLDSLAEQAAPAVEYMKSQRFAKEAADYLPPAPKGLPNTLATWKDVFLQTGQMIGTGAPRQQKIFATS